MKKLIILSLLALPLTACHSVSLTLPGGASASVKSVGRNSSVEELTLSTNGTLTVKGYNNDEVTGLGIAVGALERIAKGAKAATGTP